MGLDSWSTWNDLFFQAMILGLGSDFFFDFWWGEISSVGIFYGFSNWLTPIFYLQKGFDSWPKFHNTGVIWWLLWMMATWRFQWMFRSLQAIGCLKPPMARAFLTTVFNQVFWFQGDRDSCCPSTFRCRCIRAGDGSQRARLQLFHLWLADLVEPGYPYSTPNVGLVKPHFPSTKWGCFSSETAVPAVEFATSCGSRSTSRDKINIGIHMKTVGVGQWLCLFLHRSIGRNLLFQTAKGLHLGLSRISTDKSRLGMRV